MFLNRQDTFNRALPIVAQLLAEKAGVEIEFAPGTPQTDGSRIRMPKVRCKDRSEEIKVLRVLIHEAGHVRFTHFDALKRCTTELQRALSNALEDPRIEAEMSKLYLGAGLYFERAFLEHHEAHLLQVIPQAEPDDVLCLYVLMRAHSELLGHTYAKKTFATCDKRLRALAGDALKDRIDALIDSRFPACRNTGQIVELAKAIADLVCSDAPDGSQSESPSEPQSDQGTDSSENGADGQSQAVAQTACGSGKSSSSSQDGSCDSTPSQGNGQDKDGEESRTRSQGQKPQSHTSKSDGIKPLDSARRVWKEANDNQRWVQCSWDSDREFQEVCAADDSDQNAFCASSSLQPGFSLDTLKRRFPNESDRGADSIRNMVSEALQETCGLRRSLQQLVIDKQRRDARLSSSGTKIQSSALARLAVGNARVFGRTTEVRGVSTALHVLLDGSGSMSCNRCFTTAMKAALAVVQVLQSLRVSTGLTLFQDKKQSVVIAHGETINQNLARIDCCHPEGATPIYGAMLAGAYQLSKRSETRKVMMVITDLEEVDPATRQVIDDLSKAGFIIIGVTVASDKAAKAFPYACAIQEASELNTALFGAVSKIFS